MHVRPVLLAFAITALASCTTPQSSAETGAPRACAPDDISDLCLLAEAESALADITELDDRIAITSDYAQALSVAGRHAEANALLDALWAQSARVPDVETRSRAQLAIVKSWAEIGETTAVLDASAQVLELANSIDDPANRQDVAASVIALTAKAGNAQEALRQALELPQDGSTLASFKSRALREIAKYSAEAGDFEAAADALAANTMGLVYYRNVARVDVAAAAFRAGREDKALRLISEAEAAARRDPDGYFAAGAMRDIAGTLARAGRTERADTLFVEALFLTNQAKSPQEQARAISRIVTVMADVGMTDGAAELLNEALSIAEEDEREPFRDFARYEIAGSAAFAGQFELAEGVAAKAPQTPFGSATSLRAVIQRDIAWGRMRFGDVRGAVATARAIATPRERAQALIRLVLLRADPEMEAPPRYL